MSAYGHFSTTRMWCVDCGREALPLCDEEAHDTRGLSGYLRKQAGDRLVLLADRMFPQCKEEVGLLRSLKDSAEAEMQEWVDADRQLVEQIEKLQREALTGDEEARRLCAERVEDLLALETAPQQLLHAAGPLPLSVGGWSADGLFLWQHPVLLLALLHLQRRGLLRHRALKSQWVEKGVPQETEADEKGAMVVVDLKGTNGCPEDKVTLLSRPAVHVLKRLNCLRDPMWALTVLSKHADTLQEVQLEDVNMAHLTALMRMPKLLHLQVCDAVPALSGHPKLHAEWKTQKLQSMRVAYLPEHITLSLLHPHAPTLEELHLTLGSAEALALLPSMPRLKRLALESEDCRRFAWEPNVSDGDTNEYLERWRAPGLQWLRLQGLPAGLALRVLWAHRHHSPLDLELVCECCADTLAVAVDRRLQLLCLGSLTVDCTAQSPSSCQSELPLDMLREALPQCVVALRN